jgi:DNA-binding NarL/FixJ family response regulator
VIRVLLVDDQPLVREGLRRILHPDDGFTIVGECDDGDQVVESIAAARPDVVVMDIRMRRVDGVEATRRIRNLDDGPPVLVLTTFDDDEVLSRALHAGAAGFQLKDAPGEELIMATAAVASGESWLDPAVTARVLSAYRASVPIERVTPTELERLTPRELEVLRLMARGSNNTEIAAELFVSEVTVKSHVGHIFTKLNLRDRAAAIVFAYDHSLVTPPT